WGQDLQVAHRDLMQERLAVSQAPLLRETTSHLTRLRQILSSIDPEALAPPGGIGTHAFRRLSRLIDTPDELARARGEIDALLRLLTPAQTGLMTLRDQLQRHATALQTMEAQVEAQALAAGWLTQNAAPEHCRSFADRRNSLAATLLQIRSATLQLTNDIVMPSRLILAVQTIALVALPAWLDRLSHLQNRLSQGRTPTPTEARELAFRLNDLLPLFPRTE
ncbi:MAG: hypothetical protein H7317_04695, partial [Pseudorhodobacter sp.]|nr:hypothetical protein [Pseudorhodobacter sp.]